MAKKVIVIGSGFAELCAASFMAKAGWKVIALEKCNGKLCVNFKTGFTFNRKPDLYLIF